MSTILRNKILILICIYCIIALCNYLPLPWNEPINNILMDLQLKVRGDRPISDDIVIVFIGDDDVRVIGNWPMTRDYYGYFIHVTHTLGAKVIAMDVLFAAPNNDHPEYDLALAQFIKSANNVCLPMIYSELTLSENTTQEDYKDLYFGENPMYTFERFRELATGTGFSNLGISGIVRKTPLLVNSEVGLTPSLGLEAARLFLSPTLSIQFKDEKVRLYDQEKIVRSIPTNRMAELRLNHFGDLENIQAYNFIDVLKTFEENPDSLDFKNKLVYLLVSASGISNVHSTPLSDIFPASLIHITVAENIISQNYFVRSSMIIETLLIGLMISLAYLIWTFAKKYWLIVIGVSLPIIYISISQVLLNDLYYNQPVFYPFLGYLIVLFYLSGQLIVEKKVEDESIKKLMEDEIQSKEKRLHTTQEQLKKIQKQLNQETQTSEKSIQEVEEQKEAILKLAKELSDLKSYVIPELDIMKLEFTEIVHAPTSPMINVLDLVSKVGTDDIPVLIVGDTGTGKELVARAIHQTGKRKDKSFVAINCGALSDTLLESELFGHEKGAFTGAQSQRKGRFELADGGTIFLDEISETSPAFQTKLLRILQEGIFERVGGEQSIQVDVRVIAATNKQLEKEISNEKFRSDLYYRLNGFTISLPPLCDRIDDIPVLVSHFLKKYEHESVVKISDRAMNQLKVYAWPGNVRELENTVRRAAILAKSAGRKIIQVEDLPQENMQESLASMHLTMEEQILRMMRSLEFSRSAISQTAKALGNKDRGTITEYFRGICFEKLVQANFDIDIAVKEIAESSSNEVIKRVRQKMDAYLDNLKTSDLKDGQKSPAYKGLPQKFHISLDSVIKYLQTN